MNRGLLIAGGILNTIFTIFHILMGWQFQFIPELAEEFRVLLQMLNVGAVLMVGFAAYASFFCKSDLVETKLGKSLLVLVALYYGARAVEEIILSPAFSVIIFTLCLLVAALYLAAAFWRPRAAVTA